MSTDSLVSDLRLLAVVGPPVVKPGEMLDACLAAEAGGVTSLQVRWKNATASELVDMTENLVQSLSIPVYVNDRADVAFAAAASGVHVGADDLDPNRVRSMSPSGFLIGVSVGTEVEAEGARVAKVDYWSIGPIYHTDTKRDAGSPVGTSGFRKLAALAPSEMPVIAIGGIDRSNVTDVLRAGAVGVAVINAIFGSREIEDNARALRAIIDDVLSSNSS
jgi:thiamine-phosphate pyrophosphorylase